MLRRATLHRILRKVAAQPDGIARSEVFRLHRVQTAEFWNGIRDTPYPKGLRGLVSEERCRNDEFGTNHPTIKNWFITSAGAEFLARVLRNPDALPPENIKPERQLISPDARELAREEKREAIRHQKNLEKWQRRQRHPKHAGSNGKSPYCDPPKNADVDINSPEFRRLPSLERVRILHAQSKSKHQSEPFTYGEPVVPWTAEEWAVVEQQLNPNRKVKPPKPFPLPEPDPDPPKPQPLKSTLDEIAEAQAKIRMGMTEAELVEHEKRVADLLRRK
jgi:hypothetical protein